MVIRRFGSPGFHGIGGMALADMGAACPGGAVTPWSLSYDGNNDETNLGVGASIVGLNAAPFTVDMYWQAVAQLGGSDNTFVSQGDPTGGAAQGGWTMAIFGVSLIPATCIFRIVDGTATSRRALVSTNLTAGNWYYWRGRLDAGNNIKLSLNAGAEGTWAMVGTTTSIQNAHIGCTQRAGPVLSYFGKGLICYVHIWNVDKGALAAVPVTPYAVDGNTVARYIHSEGAGASLGDTSGNANNGVISGAAWNATVPAGWTI